MNADIDLSTENSDHMNNAQAAIAAIIVNHNVGSLLLDCPPPPRFSGTHNWGHTAPSVMEVCSWRNHRQNEGGFPRARRGTWSCACCVATDLDLVSREAGVTAGHPEVDAMSHTHVAFPHIARRGWSGSVRNGA